MNANELADGILAIEERIFLTKKEHQLFQNSATMLRQQQSEIEALKQIIDANNLNQNIGQFVKPTNEPVAWARQDGVIAFHKQKEVDSQGYKWFPLYTHPVKEQEIKEAKYGITTKWDGITTYHETTEPIGKAQKK